MGLEKFCRFHQGQHIPYDYGNQYFRQPCGAANRLVIGPSGSHIDLLIELAAELHGQPWFVLYVLLVPRLGNRSSGRYQSEPFGSLAELAMFLSAFRSFFESDGRHHVWVGSARNDGLLVYDHHNVLFAYGPLDAFEQALLRKGYRQQEFWFPAFHAHSYAPENDLEEERLMTEMEWKYSPLQPGDEWE